MVALPADALLAERLRISEGDPVLCNEHTVYDTSEQKVEFGRSWFRADRVVLRSTVRRGAAGDVYSIVVPVGNRAR